MVPVSGSPDVPIAQQHSPNVNVFRYIGYSYSDQETFPRLPINPRGLIFKPRSLLAPRPV